MMIFPYIARSTAEPHVKADLLMRNGRLSYRDERPEDRDAMNVLWARQIMAHEQGSPVFGKIHSARQRYAALSLLCQVCAGEPDENDDGILWLLPSRDRQRDTGSSRLVVAYPPICASCCEKALRLCPPLRQGHVLLRVGDVRPVGVLGIAHDRRARPVGEEGRFHYQHPRLHRVLASQQLLELQDCRAVAALLA